MRIIISLAGLCILATAITFVFKTPTADAVVNQTNIKRPNLQQSAVPNFTPISVTNAELEACKDECYATYPNIDPEGAASPGTGCLRGCNIARRLYCQ